ncbi:hypothetical protein [Devosia aurantiaca]|uniref:Uncharacterized protein n=1 Tax=Devosia aurantiaca TaxID=2714858 RepID=A0A6M1SGR8_9HYPH|nr:hypothetical protein [Devosia aurantiaca]NGP16370.1 hypothetical protein [Devosia aurantiaca]
MSDLDQSETLSALPVTTATVDPRPSLARSAPTAAFVSQLIAARDRMAPQRVRRQGTPEAATSAYNNGARIAERRMPAGYRKTVVV